MQQQMLSAPSNAKKSIPCNLKIAILYHTDTVHMDAPEVRLPCSLLAIHNYLQNCLKRISLTSKCDVYWQCSISNMNRQSALQAAIVHGW